MGGGISNQYLDIFSDLRGMYKPAWHCHGAFIILFTLIFLQYLNTVIVPSRPSDVINSTELTLRVVCSQVRTRKDTV